MSNMFKHGQMSNVFSFRRNHNGSEAQEGQLICWTWTVLRSIGIFIYLLISVVLLARWGILVIVGFSAPWSRRSAWERNQRSEWKLLTRPCVDQEPQECHCWLRALWSTPRCAPVAWIMACCMLHFSDAAGWLVDSGWRRGGTSRDDLQGTRWVSQLGRKL